MGAYGHIPEVKKVMKQLELVPTAAMSGDETEYDDDGERSLVTNRCQWRSKEASDLFQICDALDMSSRFSVDDSPDPGRFPDIRKQSNRPDNNRVPKSLPENWYDPQFKDTLTVEERERLDMRPSFSFLLPANVLR